MSRYTGPKNRVARKFRANIFEKKRNPLVHKPHPPGMHGARRKKQSDYGQQLEEKQKLAAFYGMLRKKNLVRYYREAVRRPGNTIEEFVQQLECRLDVVVYRLNMASSIFHAQQLVSHGHVRVNGKKVDIRSFQVKPGMQISLKEKIRENLIVKESLESTTKERPTFLEFDAKTCSGSIVVYPKPDQVPFTLPINPALACEYLAYTT